MAGGKMSAAGAPPISFHAHLVRAGEAGASQDFEQMLALLVPRIDGNQARLVWANPGDWGIDVLVGDLNRRVTIWQAKFFVRGFGRSQREQVTSSFQAATRVPPGSARLQASDLDQHVDAGGRRVHDLLRRDRGPGHARAVEPPRVGLPARSLSASRPTVVVRRRVRDFVVEARLVVLG